MRGPGPSSLLLPLLLLASCGGGGGSTAPASGGLVVVTPTPTPVPAPSPTPTPDPTPTPSSTPTPAPTPAPVAEAHFGGIAGQDMAIVGSKLFVSSSSDSDHMQKAGWVRDSTTLALLGYFSQNISHAAAIDYAAATDTMVIGNAGDTNSAAPRIDLLTGFSRYGVGSVLDWNDTASTPRVSIALTLYAADGTTVIRSALPNPTFRTVNAVWGSDAGTVVLFTGDRTNPITIVLLQLGTGAADYSAQGYGTFVAGSRDGAFNGTARVLSTYTSTLKGTTQGAKWRGGKLYLGWTSATVAARAMEVLELTPQSDGTLTTTDDYRYLPTNSDGTTATYETEAVTFRGADMLVSGRRLSDNYQSIYRFVDHTSVAELTP